MSYQKNPGQETPGKLELMKDNYYKQLKTRLWKEN